MSSDSQTSSIDSPPPRQQPHTLDRIWESIQQTKALSQILDRQPTPQHHQYRQHVQLQSSPFETRQCKQNLAHMVRKVHNLQDQVKMLKYKLEQERYAHEAQISSLRRQYENRLRTELKKVRYNEKENLSHQKESGQVESLSRQNQKLTLRLRSMELEVKSCQEERKRLAELNDLYIQKLSEEKTGEGQLGQGEQLLELEEANRTVCRLVELLRKTQEYREFAPLMQQVGDMHYLRTILKRLKLNQLNYKPIQRKMCSCRGMKVTEKILWSPVECYKVMLSMKMKYDFLSEDCIEEVLFEMNRLYTAKEEKIISRIKQSHELEINKIKKQMELGYDEVLTKKQVSRLKKELSVVKSAQKARMPPRMDHFKDKGQLADQLKLHQKEIKLLKERIKLFESETGYQDKSLYYQGTLSALDKVLGELENNEATLKQFQMKFRARVQDNIEPEDWLGSYKEFFETLEELSGGLVERILTLKEAMLRKMGKIE